MSFDLRCVECGHVFTAADVDAEDETTDPLCHPCPVEQNGLPLVWCESYREEIRDGSTERCKLTRDLFADGGSGR